MIFYFAGRTVQIAVIKLENHKYFLRYVIFAADTRLSRRCEPESRIVFRMPENSHSANPQAVQAIVEVGLEAMKTPPPEAIQREIQHFLTADPKTSDYVNEVLVQSMGNAMSTLTSMPAQTMLPLQKLGSKIMGNNLANTVGSAQPDSYQ